MAQQAAEKAIKSALVFLAIDFPKTHDLDAPRNLLPGGWHLRRTSEDLAELTEWSVEARYPGDWPEATGADALRALAKAKAVLQSVTGNLRELDKQWTRVSAQSREQLPSTSPVRPDTPAVLAAVLGVESDGKAPASPANCAVVFPVTATPQSGPR